MPDPDNQWRWLNTCCPDWEDGFSMNPCCPVNFTACVSLYKSASLCGFSEFSPAEINPKKYARLDHLNTGSTNWAGTLEGGCDATTGVRPFTASISLSWNKQYSYPLTEGAPCELNSSYISWSSNGSFCDDDCSGSGIKEEAGGIGSKIHYTYSGASCGFPDVLKTPITEIASSTQFIQTWSDTVTTPGGTSAFYANATSTLSIEDTESSALNRIADWTQGNSCTSSNPDRGAGVFTQPKTTVKFQGVGTGLVIGFCYEGIIEIQQRDAPVIELIPPLPPVPEPIWTTHSLVTIPQFVAGNVFQTFGGGALNVSDEDFIDKNFSLDPYDYPSYFPVDPETGILIDPDALVIDPTTSLPSAKGKEYRVLSPILRRIDCPE